MRGQHTKAAAVLRFALTFIVLHAVRIVPVRAAGPDPVLVQIQIEPQPVPAGQPFYVTVVARNHGDLAWDGYITMGFPDNPIVDIAEHDGTCPTDNICLGPAYVVHPGAGLLHYDTRQTVTAVYPIAEACYRDWQAGATHYLRVQVTPRDYSRPTLVYVRISMRGYAGDRRAQEIVTYPPTSSQLDQQGFPVHVEVVHVLEPSTPTSLPPTPTAVIHESPTCVPPTPSATSPRPSATAVPRTPTPTCASPSPTVLPPISPTVVIQTAVSRPLLATEPPDHALWGWGVLGLVLLAALVLGVTVMRFGAIYRGSAQEAEGDVMTCPACGASSELDAEFCVNCGTKLAVPEKPKVIICPKCGAENEPRARFCTDCGTKLGPS